MTGNQINYAMAVEGVRHDKASEGETNRHNAITESIQQESNRIAEEKNQITAAYNQRSLDLQEQMNAWQREFTTANEARKRELEQEKLIIEARIAANDREYKQSMANVAKQEATIKQQSVDEAITHNRNMEQYQRDYLNATKWMNEAKTILEAYSINENLGIKREELNVQRDKLDADIILRTQMTNAQTELLKAQTEKTGTDTIYTNKQIWWAPFNNFWNGMRNAGAFAGAFLK